MTCHKDCLGKYKYQPNYQERRYSLYERRILLGKVQSNTQLRYARGLGDGLSSLFRASQHTPAIRSAVAETYPSRNVPGRSESKKFE